MYFRLSLYYSFLIVFIAFTSCTPRNELVKDAEAGWEEQLTSQIELLGHRNWIVVADAAYPLQSNAGIKTLLSNYDHVTTIKKVDELIKQQKHIKPIIYFDKELDYISDADAPGIESFRIEIESLLSEDSNKEVHEDIICKLDEASKLFNVVIIKTNFSLPYTSVFFQLDCKYWNAEAENRLRTKMNNDE